MEDGIGKGEYDLIYCVVPLVYWQTGHLSTNMEISILSWGQKYNIPWQQKFFPYQSELEAH